MGPVPTSKSRRNREYTQTGYTMPTRAHPGPSLIFKSMKFGDGILWSAYILFTLTFLIVNWHQINVLFYEDGDTAANALQIMRAVHLKEYLGCYSRFLFNHPGPAFYYYYAFTEPLFFFMKSPYAKHILAQWLLNNIFIIVSLRILARNNGHGYRTLLYFAAMLFVIAPLHISQTSEISPLVSLWPPSAVIFPMMLLVLSFVEVINGRLQYLLGMTIPAVLILHNYLSIVIPVGILGLIALAFIVHSRFVKQISLNRIEITFFFLSVAFVLLSTVPIIYEQLKYGQDGNIVKIIMVFKSFPFFNQPLSKSFLYVIGFFSDPLTFKTFNFMKPSYSVASYIALPVLALFSSAIYLDDTRAYERRLFVISLFGLVLSIFSAAKVIGELHHYLFWFQYIFVWTIYYTALIGFVVLTKRLARVLPKTIARISTSTSVQFIPVIIVLIAIVISTPVLFRLKTADTHAFIPAIVKFIRPVKNRVYLLDWVNCSAHHLQWNNATGVALELKRRGYRACVNDEWLFMFGRELKCDDEKHQVRISFFNENIVNDELAGCTKTMRHSHGVVCLKE